MSTVTSMQNVTQSTTSLQSNAAGYTARAPKAQLDQDDFMKLLSTQMQTQDPLKPMEDTAFISQMASFSSLAQMSQLTKDFSSLRADSALNTASSYIGKQITVSYLDDKGATVQTSGIVDAVENTSEGPQLQIAGYQYPLSSVLRIETPPPSNGSTPS